MCVQPSLSPSPWLWIRVPLCAPFNLFFFFLVGVSSVYLLKAVS